jgi:hypothetical protein
MSTFIALAASSASNRSGKAAEWPRVLNVTNFFLHPPDRFIFVSGEPQYNAVRDGPEHQSAFR